jgi:quercetin dioxygenase-like cupin family protein
MSSLADSRPISDEPRQAPAIDRHPGCRMSWNDNPDRLSFLGRPLPPRFEMRVVNVAPGDTMAYREAEWRGALVVIERGRIQLEGPGGGRREFTTGDVLCLAGLSLRALHNRGPEPAVLVAVSRRR